MAKNLEIKVKLENFDFVLSLLHDNGYSRKELLLQKDIYYDTPEGRLKLRIENGRERLIRYSRKEAEGEERFSDYELLEISSGNGEKFFGAMFNTKYIVEKSRQLYIIKNTRVHIDEVKSLGKFLELETIVTSGEENARNEFAAIIKLLELHKYPEIRESYSDLIAEIK